MRATYSLLRLSPITLLFFCGCAAEMSRESTVRAVRVSMIPTTDPTRAARENALLVSHFERATGGPVTITVPVTYAAVVEALVNNQVDLAYLGGFTYVQAAARAGVTPLVQRERDRAFHSVIIAGSESGVRSLDNLRGRTFAFGDINSTSGHVMPAYFMRKAGVPEEVFVKAIYSGGHDATALAVANGRVAAGALDETIFERLLQQGAVPRDRVVLVYRTPPFFDYVWVTRRQIDLKLRESLKQAFLRLEPGRAGDEPLLQVLGATRYLPAADSDYDALRQAAREQGLLR